MNLGGGKAGSEAELSFVHKFERGRAKTTLLLLHGTGGDENDMVPLGHAISPQSSVLSPRGKVLEEGMPRFFRRLREGVFDVEDLRFRSKELSSFVKEASTRYKFDLDSVVAVGYSNGANIAASVLLLGLLSMAGGALFRPMVPLIPGSLPNLQGVAIFLSAGTRDPIVARTETERLAEMLRRAGCEVEINWEDADHGITEDEIRRANKWFNMHFL